MKWRRLCSEFWFASPVDDVDDVDLEEMVASGTPQEACTDISWQSYLDSAPAATKGWKIPRGEPIAGNFCSILTQLWLINSFHNSPSNFHCHTSCSIVFLLHCCRQYLAAYLVIILFLLGLNMIEPFFTRYLGSATSTNVAANHMEMVSTCFNHCFRHENRWKAQRHDQFLSYLDAPRRSDAWNLAVCRLVLATSLPNVQPFCSFLED